MKFSGKTAVITGGGSGIGRGTCLKLAGEGAKVIVADINEAAANQVAKEIKEKGGTARAFKLDVTNYAEIEKLGNQVKKDFGFIDFWINDAGVSKILPFFEHTEEIWDQTIAVNLKGQFLCCKVAIAQMLENGGGNIVNMSSQSGKVGTSNYQAYCASKFGVIGLTQSLSKEFAGKGIRVNAVCPGVVYTSMWEKQEADYAAKRNLDPHKVMDYFKDKIPANRIGTVNDVTNTITFLLSNESSYITGQAINVNGGDIMF